MVASLGRLREPTVPQLLLQGWKGYGPALRLQVLDVTESGREIGLNLLMPGDYFGELSIIDGQPRSETGVGTTYVGLF